VFVAAAFVAITAVAWFAVPGPRWALVTVGASATYLLIVVGIAAFPMRSRARTVLAVIAAVSHVTALTLTLDVAPTLSLGDPPGRMLTSLSIQSTWHAIRYQVPFPQPTGDRMRVKLILARPYAGPANLLIDVSGRVNGTMCVPSGGNESEREFTFDMPQFRADAAVTLTISPDAPDPDLRIAVWKSGLGRTLPDEPKYVTDHGMFTGLPDPLTGMMIRGWPLVWITGA
jgi:hypothetical protein